MTVIGIFCATYAVIGCFWRFSGFFLVESLTGNQKIAVIVGPSGKIWPVEFNESGGSSPSAF